MPFPILARKTMFGGKRGPTLDIDFSGGVMPGNITYTRASAGTYYDPSTGRITSASTNIPRFQKNANGALAFLWEVGVSNILQRSEEIDNAYWTKTNYTVSANASVAPDGLTSMDSVLESAVSLAHSVSKTSIAVSANALYNLSFYVQAISRNRFTLTMQDTTTGLNKVTGTVNLGAVTNAASASGSGTAGNALIQTIVTSDGTYYRVSVSGKIDSSSTTMDVIIGGLDDSGNATYLGDVTKGLKIWGAQLENFGSESTPLGGMSSYIMTTSASASRAADSALYNNAPFINQAEGTLYIKFSALAITGSQFPALLALGIVGDASGNDRHLVGFADSTRRGFGLTSAGGVQQASNACGTTGELDNGGVAKAAWAYALNNCIGYSNGLSGTLDTVATMPTGLTTLAIGSQVAGGNTARSALIERIQYYTSRLPNGTLQVLTT